MNDLGNGDTSPDAALQGSSALILAEPAGQGNRRVNEVQFTANESLDGSTARNRKAKTTPLHSIELGTAAVVDGVQLHPDVN